MPPADMAAMIVGELERAGAIRRDGGFLVPSGRGHAAAPPPGMTAARVRE